MYPAPLSLTPYLNILKALPVFLPWALLAILPGPFLLLCIALNTPAFYFPYFHPLSVWVIPWTFVLSVGTVSSLASFYYAFLHRATNAREKMILAFYHFVYLGCTGTLLLLPKHPLLFLCASATFIAFFHLSPVLAFAMGWKPSAYATLWCALAWCGLGAGLGLQAMIWLVFMGG